MFRSGIFEVFAAHPKQGLVERLNNIIPLSLLFEDLIEPMATPNLLPQLRILSALLDDLLVVMPDELDSFQSQEVIPDSYRAEHRDEETKRDLQHDVQLYRLHIAIDLR